VCREIGETKVAEKGMIILGDRSVSLILVGPNYRSELLVKVPEGTTLDQVIRENCYNPDCDYEVYEEGKEGHLVQSGELARTGMTVVTSWKKEIAVEKNAAFWHRFR
jgi:hypothetical protein